VTTYDLQFKALTFDLWALLVCAIVPDFTVVPRPYRESFQLKST
jgi:hypothetical protein